MSARILKVTDLAVGIRQETAGQAAVLQERGVVPRVVGVLAGESPATARALAERGTACHDVGITLEAAPFHNDMEIAELDDLWDRMARDRSITGVMIRRAVECFLTPEQLVRHLPPAKDVEAVAPSSLARVVAEPEEAHCPPPLAAAVLATLTTHEIDVYDKVVLVAGHSRALTMALASALTLRHAVVVLAGYEAPVPAHLYRSADLLIAGGQERGSLGADFVKPGAVLLDLGAPGPGASAASASGGGCFSSEAVEQASAILPAGGMAPLEEALFLHNVVEAARAQAAETPPPPPPASGLRGRK